MTVEEAEANVELKLKLFLTQYALDTLDLDDLVQEGAAWLGEDDSDVVALKTALEEMK